MSRSITGVSSNVFILDGNNAFPEYQIYDVLIGTQDNQGGYKLLVVGDTNLNGNVQIGSNLIVNNDITAVDIDITGEYSVNGTPITDTTYAEGNNISISNSNVITTESDLSSINSITSHSNSDLTLNAGTANSINFQTNQINVATLESTKFSLFGDCDLSNAHKYKINNLQIDSNDVLYDNSIDTKLLKTSIDEKQSLITSSNRLNANLLSTGIVSNDEFNRLNNITSNILNVTDSIIEKKNSEIDNKLSETDEGYFYKPWNKMSTVHKIIKIKQFVNNMNIENDKKSKLITYLKTALKKKIISKNDQVIYNISQAKIVSIPKLELKNNSFSIN